MAHNYWLEFLTVIAVLVFCVFFLYTSSVSKDAAFPGSDSIAAAKISGSAGTSAEKIQPLIPQWVPPSAEIESTLFGLQAALGGLLIGGVFGYWIGQKKRYDTSPK
jgi:cobalt/nickel transport protein